MTLYSQLIMVNSIRQHYYILYSIYPMYWICSQIYSVIEKKSDSDNCVGVGGCMSVC